MSKHRTREEYFAERRRKAEATRRKTWKMLKQKIKEAGQINIYKLSVETGYSISYIYSLYRSYGDNDPNIDYSRSVFTWLGPKEGKK